MSDGLLHYGRALDLCLELLYSAGVRSVQTAHVQSEYSWAVSYYGRACKADNAFFASLLRIGFDHACSYSTSIESHRAYTPLHCESTRCA